MILIQIKPVGNQTLLSLMSAVPHVFLIVVLHSQLSVSAGSASTNSTNRGSKIFPPKISRKFQKAKLEFATSQRLFT